MRLVPIATVKSIDYLEFLPFFVFFRCNSLTVKVGDVYEITMTEANGIKPKPGDASRDKYFVVLGFDTEEVAYGGVIINSQINKNLPSYIKMYHMPIRQSKY